MIRMFYFIGAVIIFTSCSIDKRPENISFGHDQCAYCKMTISNPKFGAELITDKGRIHKYDAAECMVDHVNEGSVDYYSLYAVAYDRPKQLIHVDSLHYIISPGFRSPMGANLAAIADIKNLEPKYHDQLIDWATLLKTLRE